MPTRSCWSQLDTPKVLEEGGEDNFVETWGLLFYAGSQAKANGIPFDSARSDLWKEGWICVDISLGMLGEKVR
ncbi:hypothetical protein HDF08_003515 [Edaphobacter lichenicola]|uniref:Uncharacterized protein n=1 Tax=Tunturiibacter lichenicola TaxID=2051959 RepID=A0A852VF00_9BACT|nr:hypothetical protein [Edaphobacter lichenicola]